MTAPISAVTSTLRLGDKASLKRLVWAYGCAKTGSDEERKLEVMCPEWGAVQLHRDNPTNLYIPDGAV